MDIQTIKEVKKDEDRLKELEFRLVECNKLLQIQLSQMSMNQISNESNIYMGGLYNGMELLMSVLEDRKPMFCDLSVVEENQSNESELKGTEEAKETMAEKVAKTISGKIYNGGE